MKRSQLLNENLSTHEKHLNESRIHEPYIRFKFENMFELKTNKLRCSSFEIVRLAYI